MREQVTILIYTFPKPGAEEGAFAKIAAAIERTWRQVGRLKTVIVASHRFAAVERFVAKHGEVELQVERAPIISDGWKRKLAYGLAFGSFRRCWMLQSPKNRPERVDLWRIRSFSA